MIKHIVFFKWEEDSLQRANELKKKLLNLKEKIEEIKEWEVGINFSISDRAYDMSLISSFNSKEDLKAYAIHPEHMKVIDFIKETKAMTKVVDYDMSDK